MTDNYIPITPGTGVGAKVETSELFLPNTDSDATAAWRTVDRQRVDVGDDPGTLVEQTGLLREILLELQHLRLALLNALH